MKFVSREETLTCANELAVISVWGGSTGVKRKHVKLPVGKVGITPDFTS